MKAFKIKKRSHRQAVFIIGPPVTSFPKPKLPLFLLWKIHPPALFKQFTWVVQESVRQESQAYPEPEAYPLLVSPGLRDLVEQSASRVFESLPLEAAS
jgi:hypothetical protein